MPQNPIIERIKQLNLPEIITSYGIKSAPRLNGTHNFYCPFHQDNNPSLKVNQKGEKWLWNCFGCEAGGTVIDFVMRQEGVNKRSAIETLSQRLNRTNTQTLPVNRKSVEEKPLSIEAQKLLNKTAEYYHTIFLENTKARDYLNYQRGIKDGKIFTTFKVGYADGTLKSTLPKKGEAVELLKESGILTARGHEHFKDCVVFPIYDEHGNCVEMYGRKITKGGTGLKHLYLKGIHRGVFNYHVIKTHTSIILTESIIDAISLYQAGYKNTLALYGTNGLTEDHLALFKKHNLKEVYLCMDGDEAGRRAADRLSRRLTKEGLNIYEVILPEGSDPNEYFKKHEAKDFELLLRVAGAEGILTESNEEKIEILSDGIKVDYGLRSYFVRGMEAVKGKRLRANLKAVTDKAFHIDTMDLYVARSRKAFAREAGLLYGKEPEIIENDLNRMIERLEDYVDGKEANNKVIVMTEVEQKEALSFLKSKQLIEQILSDVSVLGCAGERTNKLMGYLAAVSRKTDDPLSLLVLSRSAAGKSMLQDTILQLVPEEDKHKYTRITGQALFYKGEDSLKHKLVAIEEEEGSHQAAYSIRTIQSSKELTIATTTKDPLTGQMKTQEYKVKGPLSIIITTTSNEIDHETMNRFIVLTIDESREQTRMIHKIQRQRDTLEGLLCRRETEVIIRKHHNAQRLLKSVKVVNPYAEYLSYNDDQLRSRRDHKKYLNLIKVVAFLHQHQRETKNIEYLEETIEYIEVTLKDISLANELAHEVLGRSLDELSPQSRRLLNLIWGMIKTIAAQNRQPISAVRFTRKDVREHTGWSDNQVRDHLGQLVDLEYIHMVSGRNGSRMTYEMIYDGEGHDGKKFFMGLTDVKELCKKARKDSNLVGEKGNLVPSLSGACPQLVEA